MKKLILHCGLHKTGTTAIQKTLFSHKKTLNNVDWDFVSPDSSGNSSSLIDTKLNSQGIFESVIKESFFKIANSSNFSNVILSAEYLSFLSTEEAIRPLTKLKEFFDEVLIVFYLRRQDQLYQSFKIQASKCSGKGSMPSSLLLGHDLEEFPESYNKNIDNYFNYYQKLKLWETVFGNDKLIIFHYDKKSFLNGDVVDDFIHRLSIPLKLDRKAERENIGG
jgi:hypothetical protein